MRGLKKLIKRTPGFRSLESYLRKRYTGFPDGERYNRGDFYSPLPDLDEVASSDHFFRKDVDLSESIDLENDAQLKLLKVFSSFYEEFPYKQSSNLNFRFHLGQDWFCHADALTLYSMLRQFQPKRVVEVGSGFSSALMLDTADHFLEHPVLFTFIDPYPERLLSVLRKADLSRTTIHQQPVQKIPLSSFKELEANDILFVDSSHVSKIASDVNFLVFEVLPILNPGVIIHFHDILWPFEYSREWVLQKRAWNEAYLLRAFLQFNSDFQVLFFNSYMGHMFEAEVKEAMPLFLENTGGSLWIQRC